MKKQYVFLSLFTLLLLTSCATSKKSDSSTADLRKELTQKNRANITLLNQIRQLPGVTLRYGVPVINSATNSINGLDNPEPLYVLNDYIVGSSFSSVNELVDNFNVKEIEVLDNYEASFYGSRAAKGVIKITTTDYDTKASNKP